MRNDPALGDDPRTITVGKKEGQKSECQSNQTPDHLAA
jgi:hypothetical protein